MNEKWDKWINQIASLNDEVVVEVVCVVCGGG